MKTVPSQRKVLPATSVFFCFLLPVLCVIPAGAEKAPTSQYLVLDNGFKVFLLERPGLPLVHIAAAVNAGSKDETPEISGISHLLEHAILFGGTGSRSGDEVARDIRRHGAYINAHTGHDMTLFVMTLPSEHAVFGLENQKNILFDLAVDADRLEEEKTILLEEMRLLEDDPVRFGTALVIENLFSGHPYALPVQGRPESLRGLTAHRIHEFYRRYFTPGNAALAVVGDFSIDEIEPRIRSIFGDIPDRPIEETPFPQAAPPPRNVEIEQTMDVSQAYVFIGFSVPGSRHPDRFAFQVMAEVLGRGVHPLLFLALRGPRNLVHGAGVNYLGLAHGGALIASLTLDPGNLKSARREALNTLRRLRNENFSPDDVLGEARFEAFDFLGSEKNRIRLANEQGRENGLNLATALAGHLLTLEDRPAVDHLKMIDSVRSTDLRRIAAEHISRGRPVMVTIVPMEKTR